MLGKALKIGTIAVLGISLQLFSLASIHAQPSTSAATTTSGGYSTYFRIEGAVNNPTTFTLGKLKALPPTNENVFFYTGQGPVSSEYTGVLLWDLLNSAGIKLDSSVKNDIITKTIIVTGTDGYSVVIGAGELAPNFGGHQVIVAYEQDGKLLDQNSGFAKLIFPGDKAGGRFVSWISSIKVR